MWRHIDLIDLLLWMRGGIRGGFAGQKSVCLLPFHTWLCGRRGREVVWSRNNRQRGEDIRNPGRERPRHTSSCDMSPRVRSLSVCVLYLISHANGHQEEKEKRSKSHPINNSLTIVISVAEWMG